VTASRPEARPARRVAQPRRKLRLCAAWLCALCAGCATGASAPPAQPLEPLPSLGARAPEAGDRAARDLALALLAGDREAAAQAVRDIEALDAARAARGEAATGLLPWALDARNALIEERPRWRSAQAELLNRGDLHPALRRRMEADVTSDPLALADARLREARLRRWGGALNLLSRALGMGLANPTVLPVHTAEALLQLGLREHLADDLSTGERQALAHWKRFVEENPEAGQAADLLERLEAGQQRWLENESARSLRRARRALRAGDAARAAAHAERALRYAPDSQRARGLLANARRAQARRAAALRRSLTAAPAAAQAGADSAGTGTTAAVQADAERAGRARPAESGAADSATPAQVEAAEAALLSALLLPDGDIESAARALLQEAPRGPRADEARFALALAAAERGDESARWRRLRRLARQNPGRSNMARHAAALVNSAASNPYRAFRVAHRADQADRMRWLLFGPLAGGARDRDLPRPVEWLVETPTLLAVALGLPIRLLRFPFLRGGRRAPAVMARRYLEQHPNGERAGELRAWLLEHEEARGNYVGALQLAEAGGLRNQAARAALRERAAGQALEASLRERRRNVRMQLLAEVARSFAGSEGGRQAGRALRREIAEATPQRIRVSRAFLLENPSVAGPQGLALRPGLLDGDPQNGELHPEGLRFLGGRIMELAFLGPSGRAKDEPVRKRERIGEERLARAVAQLEEVSLHALRSDPDALPEHDAGRDLYFERARLGAVQRPDLRPGAHSSYSYLSARERHGAVRARDSILPVELVLQGSFDDFALGAFPRIRLPRKTPDAALYE